MNNSFAEWVARKHPESLLEINKEEQKILCEWMSELTDEAPDEVKRTIPKAVKILGATVVVGALAYFGAPYLMDIPGLGEALSKIGELGEEFAAGAAKKLMESFPVVAAWMSGLKDVADKAGDVAGKAGDLIANSGDHLKDGIGNVLDKVTPDSAPNYGSTYWQGSSVDKILPDGTKMIDTRSGLPDVSRWDQMMQMRKNFPLPGERAIGELPTGPMSPQDQKLYDMLKGLKNN